MNVFFTNTDPILCAREHCTIHRNKMIVEYAQILSTAHHCFDGLTEGIYKMTHKNHPSSMWVRKSAKHYDWVLKCALELCTMYTEDTGKVHKTEEILRNLMWHNPVPDRGFKKPPVAAPEEFKSLAESHSTEYAYQQYLQEKFKEWLDSGKFKVVKFNANCKPFWVGV